MAALETRGTMACLAADSTSSVDDLNDLIAYELHAVAEKVVGKTLIPGPKYVKVHTWAVTKAHQKS